MMGEGNSLSVVPTRAEQAPTVVVEGSVAKRPKVTDHRKLEEGV